MRLWAGMVLMGAVGTAAAVAGIEVRASYGARVTGDEPQYLLTAISLGEDLSLDVSDEIAAGRYLPFHEVSLNRQSRPLDARGTLVSPHDPLLPTVLAPGTAVGGWVGAKATLAIVAGALAALLLWTAARRFGVPLGAAAATVAVFAASAPFAVYGNQVYPELPAALVVAAVVAALAGPLRRSGVAVVAAGVVALPWLSIKYAPVATALTLIALVRLWRAGRRRAGCGVAATLVVAGGMFAVAHLAWYGGVTPYAAGDHFVGGEWTVMGEPDLLGRATRLIGLLVDREFGLAAWQPAWLLILPAAGLLVRTRPPGWIALALPLAAAWLTAAFVALTMHGWWWPGRQVVVGLPAAVLVVAMWAGADARRVAWVAGVGGVGVATYAWFVVEGLAGRVTWAVDFYEAAVPTYRVLAAVLPAYRAPTAATWILHAAWVAVAAALFVLGARRVSAR